jgi:hypothetical protein
MDKVQQIIIRVDFQDSFAALPEGQSPLSGLIGVILIS